MAKANHTLPVAPVAARRGVLLGALMTLAGKTATAVVPPSDTVQSVDVAAAALGAALGRLHSGEWRVTVNHELGFVLITQHRGQTAGGAQ